MTLIRWGILSTSRHAARVWLPGFREAPGGEVVAVASRNAAQARTYADTHDIPTSYGDYASLLNDSQIDAVYIPLPNSLHKTWAIQAAQAGKHVLCEKPLGLNAAEAKEMVAAFAGTGLKFAEAFQWRHHPQAQHTRALLQSGAIGNLRLIEAGFSFTLDEDGNIRGNPAVGGGALYDVGCYTVSLVRFMTGQEPVSVTAQAIWRDTGVDDLMVATLAFPDGVLAHINFGFILPLRRYYEVVGTTGSLAVNHAYNPKDDYPGEVIQRGNDRAVIKTHQLETVNSYTLMIEDFNRVILEDRAPLFSAQDAIGNMRVIDAIYRAAREGGTVAVEVKD